MIDLSQMFEALYHGVNKGDERYRIESEYKLVDTNTGLEYHFHNPQSGKPWEIYYQDEVLITGQHMTPEECKYLQPIADGMPKMYAEEQRSKVLDIWSSSDAMPEVQNGRL